MAWSGTSLFAMQLRLDSDPSSTDIIIAKNRKEKSKFGVALGWREA